MSVRLLLGAIFGLAIATLVNVNSAMLVPDARAQSVLALAFLSGYSIEAVFGVLDLVIARIRDALAGPVSGGERALHPH